MNVGHLSIYLVLCCLFLSELCSFPHIDLVHILLDLYLNISFLGVANVNGIAIHFFSCKTFTPFTLPSLG